MEKLEESLNNVETDDERVIHKIINQYSENPPLTEGSPLLRLVSCKIYSIFFDNSQKLQNDALCLKFCLSVSFLLKWGLRLYETAI